MNGDLVGFFALAALFVTLWTSWWVVKIAHQLNDLYDVFADEDDDCPQHHPQADGGVRRDAAGGSVAPPSGDGASAPGDPTSRAASVAHAPSPTPQQVIAAVDLEYRLAEAFHDRRCAYGTACHDRAAHIMWPHGEDARALAPFVAQLLAEQSDAAAPLALHRERVKAVLRSLVDATTNEPVLAPNQAGGLADAVLATAVDLDSSEPHVYLSTACLHGECGYCDCRTGITGDPKKPGECKFCTARCIHRCHRPVGDVDTRSVK